MSNTYNELEQKRFLNRIFNVTGTVTGRFYTPKLTKETDTQVEDIERQRKNKAIQRRNASKFVGFSRA